MLSLFLPMLPALLAFTTYGWTLVGVVKAIIIIAAVLGILFVILKVFNVQIPPWFIQIFWIVVAAFIGIVAIEFIASL